MRLPVFLILATCLQVSARTSYSQTVSFSGRNVPLQAVFASIEKQTGLSFFFNYALVKDAKPVTLELHEVTVEVALRETLKDGGLDFYKDGKTIFIVKKGVAAAAVAPNDSTSPTRPPGGILKAQGTVLNEAGQPLAGANVTIKGLGKGTVTDAKGEFQLNNVPAGSILLISFIGYSTQQFRVDDEAMKRIYLPIAKNELDRAVVQAYGTTTQRLATGNIGTVRAEDIEKQPVMNPLEAIQGQVAGVVVTNTSGYGSAPIKVEIRGRNAIGNFPSDPLYIIDGVPMTLLDLRNTDSYDGGSKGLVQSGITSPAGGQSPFFSINPADIESIEVLKDADATAIYGSRGANGVILITTKKGKPSKAHLDISAYMGRGDELRPYKMLNTKQYVTMREEALQNDGLPVNINNAADLVVWDTTRYTDWQKFVLDKAARAIDAQASLSGGDDKTTFRTSGSYHTQADVLNYSGGNDRGSFSFDINNKSLDRRLIMSLTGYYSSVSINQTYLANSILLAPNAPSVFDNHGKLNYSGWAPLDGYYPFQGILQPYSSKTNLLNGNLQLSYELIKGLKVKSSFGYNNIVTTEIQQTPIASLDPLYGGVTGNSSLGHTFAHNVIIEPQLEYNGYLGRGKVSALIGASNQSLVSSTDMEYGYGYTSDAFLSNIGSAAGEAVTSIQSNYKYSAVFGRATYNLMDKYIINFNARRDGSTKFGPGRQYGNFGSVGAAWIFSEESWVKRNLTFLSFGKIRGSYGTTGSDPIANFAYLSQWAFVRGSYNGTIPLSPLGHTDSLLHWQVNKKLEFTLDLGVFNDLINLEATWYRNRCNDQLVPFPTPLFTGFTSVVSNSPADVQNMGFEFLLTARIFNSPRFKWTTKFNIGINRNKLIGYPNIAQSPYAGTYVIGKPLNIRRLLHWTGVNPQTGLYTFADKNKDGAITIDYSGKTPDDTYLYDRSPKYDGGFTNTLSYNNWELSIFIYFRKQIGFNSLGTVPFPGGVSNQPALVLNRWQKPGDIASIAKFTTNPYSDPSYLNWQNSDAIYTDASFARLQNVSLTYTLITKGKNKSPWNSFKIFFRGQNLVIITKYKGSDPELQNFGGVPNPRILTAGLSINL